jgi:ABC-type transport system involved in multi-copper enzyme maturation permease subunit
MKAVSWRMLIGIVVVIIILLVIILLVAAALLLSTGNPPEGEISGVYGVVYSLESALTGVITGIAEWIDYIAGQIGRISGAL